MCRPENLVRHRIGTGTVFAVFADCCRGRVGSMWGFGERPPGQQFGSLSNLMQLKPLLARVRPALFALCLRV